MRRNQASLKNPQLVRVPVVVVVVVDEIVEQVGGLGRVVGHAAAIDRQHTGRVCLIHAEAL